MPAWLDQTLLAAALIVAVGYLVLRRLRAGQADCDHCGERNNKSVPAGPDAGRVPKRPP